MERQHFTRLPSHKFTQAFKNPQKITLKNFHSPKHSSITKITKNLKSALPPSASAVDPATPVVVAADLASPIVAAAGSGRTRARSGRGDGSSWRWWQRQLVAVEEGEGEGEPAAGPVARADVVVETRRRACRIRRPHRRRR